MGTLQAVVMRRYVAWVSGQSMLYPRSRSRLAAFAAAVQALQARPWISWGSLQVLQPSPMSAQAAIRLCKSN
jgi:hypothetical protein